MKTPCLKTSLICLALFIGGCRGGDAEQPPDIANDTSWRFSLQVDSLRLTDTVGMSAADLSSQLLTRIRASSFFVDPVKYNSNALNPSLPMSGAFIVSSRKATATEYKWSNKIALANGNSFGICSSLTSGSRQFVTCENQRVLECLDRQAQQSEKDETSDSSSGAQSSLLMRWLGSCGVAPQFANALEGNVSFKMESGQLFFSPSPLSSLLIYKGSWASYEDAQVQAIAAATLPQVSTCSRSDGSCLISPVPLSQCIGCASLEKGKLHTAFFIEGLRQDYTAIKSLLFVPE